MKTKSQSAKLNNGGFSLIELIIVIAIMVIVVSAVFASTSIMDSSRVKEVERGIEDYIILTSTKSMSVSAKEWYMTVTKEDGEFVTKLCKSDEKTVGEKTEIVVTDVDQASYDGKPTVVFNDGTVDRSIDDVNPLSIFFDSSTGRVSKITIGSDEADLSGGLGRITVKCGDYDRVLKLYYNTGKCEKEE